MVLHTFWVQVLNQIFVLQIFFLVWLVFLLSFFFFFFSVTEHYFYFKLPLGCSNNNLINGGSAPPSVLCPDSGISEVPAWREVGLDLCITGPHEDSRMLFVHSGVGFQSGPSNHGDCLAWGSGTSVASLPCDVAEISMRWPCCLPQNIFADEELEVSG